MATRKRTLGSVALRMIASICSEAGKVKYQWTCAAYFADVARMMDRDHKTLEPIARVSWSEKSFTCVALEEHKGNSNHFLK